MKNTGGETGSAMDSIRNRLLTGSMWAFSGKIVTLLGMLVVNALLARLLTPSEMGAYFLTFSVVSVMAIVAQLGLNQAVVRLVAESVASGTPGRAVWTVYLSLAGTVLGTAVVGAFLWLGGGEWLALKGFDSPLMAGVVGLAALWVAATSVQRLIAEVFRGFHDIRLATIFSGLANMLLTSLLFAGLWVMEGHSDLREVLVLSVAAGAATTVLAVVALWDRLRQLGSEGTLPVGELAHVAGPLLLVNVTIFILTQADLWILGLFRPEEEVAVYGAAARLVLMIATPLVIINAVMPPMIAEMHARGKLGQLELVLRSTATVVGVPAFLLLAAFMLLGEPILGRVYGDFYAGGALVLAILSVGYLIAVWTGSCGNVLMMTGHQNIMLATSALGGAVGVVGSVFLVGEYGGTGVAISTSVSIALQNIMMLFVVRRRLGIWTHMQFRPDFLFHTHNRPNGSKQIMGKPNFFIVGAPKCGTTAMNTYLGEHPRIFVCPRKEIHYFGSDLSSGTWLKQDVRTEAAYLEYFRGVGSEKVICESSVYYLTSANAAREIRQFNPDAQILIMLRNPADMLHSLHNQYLFTGTWERVRDFATSLQMDHQRAESFYRQPGQENKTYLGYWNVARYATQVARYFEEFGRDRVHILLYDDFKRDTRAAYEGVLEFLGLDKTHYPEFRVINSRKQARSVLLQRLTAPSPLMSRVVNFLLPRKVVTMVTSIIYKLNVQYITPPKLEEHVRRDIIDATRDEIHRLEQLIDRDLSHWYDGGKKSGTDQGAGGQFTSKITAGKKTKGVT